MAVSFVLMGAHARYLSPVRMKVLDASAPLLRLFSRAAIALAALCPGGYDAAGDADVQALRARSAELEDAVCQLRMRLADLEKSIETAPGDFRLKAAPVLEFLPKRSSVVAFDPAITRSCAVILGGTRSGLRKDLGVVWRDRVAGKVVALGERTSLVRFVHDPEFKMIARIGRTGQMGLLVGTGRRCELRYVPADADIRVGDAVVSTGDQDIFPAGKYIGRVLELPARETLLRVPVAVELPASRVRNIYVLSKKSALADFRETSGGPE